MMFKRTLCLLLVVATLVGNLPITAFADEPGSEISADVVESAPSEPLETEPPISEPQETEPPTSESLETEPTASESLETEPTSSEPQETETVPAETTAETIPVETSEETEPEETTAETLPEETTDVTRVEEGLIELDLEYSSDELFNLYFESLQYEGMSTYGLGMGAYLPEGTRAVYDAIIPILKQISNGQRASTLITIGAKVGGVTPDAYADIDYETFDITALRRALRLDCCYYFYWFDMYDSSLWYDVNWNSDGECAITILFSLDKNYRNPAYYQSYNGRNLYYMANTAKTSAASRALNNAKNVVSQYASQDDYNKLRSYAQWICRAVTYDYNAADNDYAKSGWVDAWQVVNAFDEDPSTNIVCEGYAKAYEFLCDLSQFSGDVQCYCIAGMVPGGGHMWNIVRINGRSYLTDVCWMDGGTIDYRYFLTGGTPTADGYFVVDHVRTYDDWVIEGYGNSEILHLSPTAYDPKNPPPAPVELIQWDLDGEGCLTINCSEPMPDFSKGGAPWYSRRSEVQSVIFEGNTSYIGAYAFEGCANLEYVQLPQNLQSIGNLAFLGCASLSSISVPASLTAVSSSAFRNCGNLHWIISPLSTAQLMMDALGTVTNLTISDATISAIPSYAFQNCASLKEVTLSEGITSLESYAFNNCTSLESINLPHTLTSIGEYAFGGCSRLKNVNHTGSLYALGSYAFRNCTSLESIDLPTSLSSMGKGAFYGCTSLAYIDIPQNVTVLDAYTFQNCTALSDAALPSQLIAIGSEAFAGCTSLTKISLPDSVTAINSGAFQNSGLTAVTLPKNLTSLSGQTFAGCANLTTVTMNYRLEKLINSAFKGCTSLTQVETSAKEIGASVFEGCTSLTHVLLHSSSMIEIGDSAFKNCSSLVNVAYEGWYGIGSVGSSAFENCAKLSSFPFGSGLESIGIKAFYGCANLTKVELSPKLTTVSASSFQNCTNLLSVTLPEGPAAIENYAFSGDSKLSSIIIPASVTSIGTQSFKNCGLDSVFFDGAAPSVASDSFAGVTADAYCPEDDASWTDALKAGFGGTLTWITHTPCVEHVWDSGSITREPSCTLEGLKVFTCTLCARNYSVILPITHQEVTEPGTPPTCTEDGVSDKISCSLCGLVLQHHVDISKTGHNIQLVGAVEASCTTDGYTGDQKCVNEGCAYIHTPGKAVPATGHKMELLNALEPTCTESGYTGDMRCTNEGCPGCSENTTGKPIPATGHAHTRLRIYQDVTADAVGYSHFIVSGCTNCDTWFHEQEAEDGTIIYTPMTSEEVEAQKAAYTVYHKATGISIAQTNGEAVPAMVDLTEPQGHFGLDLTATVLPASAKQAVTWASSNKEVATVESTGENTCHLNFLANGKTVITATGSDRCSAKVTIQVLTKVDRIEIECQGKSPAVAVGKSIQLQANIRPENATNKQVKWTLHENDQKYATLSPKGVLTAKRDVPVDEWGDYPSLEVTATALDGSGVSDYTFVDITPIQKEVVIEECWGSGTIKYKEATAGYIDLAKPDERVHSAYIDPNRKFIYLSASTRPHYDCGVIWASSNKNVADIAFQPSGDMASIDLLGPGTTTITATTIDGAKTVGKYVLTIAAPLTSLELGDGYQVTAGKKVTIAPSFAPALTNDKKLLWYVDAPQLATITQAGVLTAKQVSRPETVTVTAYSANNGNVFASTTVTIIPAARAVTLYGQSEKLTPINNLTQTVTTDDTGLQLYSSVYPAEAAQDVVWASSNAKIVEVDRETGKVTPKLPGTATITATAADGTGKSACLKLIVVQKMTSFDLPATAAIASGKKLTLKATNIQPANTTNKAIIWSLENPEGLTGVSLQNGVLTVTKAAKKGTVTVVARAGDNGSSPATRAEAKCEVTIYPPATSVQLMKSGNPVTEKKLIYYIGQTMPEGSNPQLSANVYPLDEATPHVVWSSTNQHVATVDASGNITPLAVGTTVIRATANDNSGKLATVTVQVLRLTDSIKIQGSSALGCGLKTTLQAVCDPTNVSTRGVTWSISNYGGLAPTQVSINAKGLLVTPKLLNEARTITVKAVSEDAGHAEAEHQITIYPAATDIQFATSTSPLYGTVLEQDVTKVLQLHANVLPQGAFQNVIWYSSNAKIARVDATGQVLPIAPGSAVITAKAADGTNRSAKFTLKVVQYMDSLSIVGSDAIAGGKELTFQAVINPSNTTNKTVQWSVVKGGPAQIKNGVLTTWPLAGQKQTLVIQAKAADQKGIYVQKEFSVYPAVSALQVKQKDSDITGKAVVMGMGETMALGFATIPEAAYQSVTWSTSNARIASVDQTGHITAKTPGVVKITVRANDGTGKTAYATVRVNRYVEDLQIQGSSILADARTVQFRATAYPANATNKAVTWSLERPNNDVSINASTGQLTIKKLKYSTRVTIVATAADGSYTRDYLTLNIFPATTQVSLYYGVSNVTGAVINSTARNTIVLKANTAPYMSCEQVTWVSSNNSIATVSSDGIVTSLRAGKVTITATAKDGTGKKASVTINFK